MMDRRSGIKAALKSQKSALMDSHSQLSIITMMIRTAVMRLPCSGGKDRLHPLAVP